MLAPTIVGHWELSWNTPIKEAELWNFPLREFEVSDWWMWPVTGIQHMEQKVMLHERPDIQTILVENADKTRVFFEPRGFYKLDSIDLPDFEHPQEDALYIFGSAHFNPTIANMEPGDVAVTIPTIRNEGVLWPHQCFVAIMYDRMMKSWR